MSKTFKSTVSPLEMGVGVTMTGDLHISLGAKAGISVAPSDAPALALAVLEAAGWPEEASNSVTHSIMTGLSDVLSIQERIATEAKEQAELEAEALELWASFQGLPADQYTFANLEDHAQRCWLAVARRAREMRAEK